ncbi:hypothetical protein AVEN_142754-1 [Araneus ventricosus]|uniref:Uncharacterized protein n=1 Tax=Araneus ventricosus TaxID=182803 RepID=A0A4Y2U5Y4_ARAVE|nr:hypothetical protein AVEN_142754-1 [Araneus ventricosus]
MRRYIAPAQKIRSGSIVHEPHCPQSDTGISFYRSDRACSRSMRYPCMIKRPSQRRCRLNNCVSTFKIPIQMFANDCVDSFADVDCLEVCDHS